MRTARAGFVGEERCPIGRRNIGDDLAIFFPDIEFMKHMARFKLEPADVCRCSFARHDRDLGRTIIDPGRHRPAGHGARKIGVDRNDRENHPVLGQEECVHQAHVRHRDEFRLARCAVGRNNIVPDFSGPFDPVDHCTDVEHFTGCIVNCGMRRKCRGDLSAIVILAQGIEAPGVKHDRRSTLHQRQQLAAMKDNVGVPCVVAFASR